VPVVLLTKTINEIEFIPVQFSHCDFNNRAVNILKKKIENIVLLVSIYIMKPALPCIVFVSGMVGGVLLFDSFCSRVKTQEGSEDTAII